MNKTIVPGEYTPASVQGRTVLDAAVENTDWKTGYMQQVRVLAGTDFASGVRMGQAYRDMEQETMAAYISPDRKAAFARTEASIREAVERGAQEDYCLELPGGCQAGISMGQFPSADAPSPSGECIASYSSLSGWTEHQTIAELEFLRESRDAYLTAWNKAMSSKRPGAIRKPHMDVTA